MIPTPTNSTAKVKIKFELVIEADSAHEIGDALSREAAKILISRMPQPPSIAGQVLTPQKVDELLSKRTTTHGQDAGPAVHTAGLHSTGPAPAVQMKAEATTIPPKAPKKPLKTKDPETKDPETKDPETKDPETKEPIAEPEQLEFKDAVQEPGAAEVSEADIQKIIRELASRKSVDFVRDLLLKFGAAKRTELKPEDRLKFAAAAKEAVKE